MPRNTYAFAVTVSAGTSKASPATTSLVFPESLVEQIDLEVPPGPRGLLGFYIARSGTQVLPFTAGEWLVWDNRMKSYAFHDLPTGSGWQAVSYNTGGYAHTYYVTFHTSPLPVPEAEHRELVRPVIRIVEQAVSDPYVGLR